MSAYIVQPEHAALLAVFAVRKDKRDFDNAVIRELKQPDDLTTAQAVAAELIKENIASVAYRYPDDKEGDRPGQAGLKDAEIVEATGLWVSYYLKAGKTVPIGHVFKLCDSLEYQSCEHPGWEGSRTKKQLDAIRNRAWTKVPGYEIAPWSYEDRNQELETLIYGG